MVTHFTQIKTAVMASSTRQGHFLQRKASSRSKSASNQKNVYYAHQPYAVRGLAISFFYHGARVRPY
jgi:hypothetical protein